MDQNKMPKTMSINGKDYVVEKLLGKVKGGYSYLVREGKEQYVLKQIHHEPCAYYQFGNKLESEIRDYHKLKEIGIRLPELLQVDTEQERILKEYIEGDIIADLVEQGNMEEGYITQMEEMCRLLYAANTNIDYFPTNFVVKQKLLYYIDYECNTYMDKWNFENWGKQYWISKQ